MPPRRPAMARMSETVAADLETRILEGSLKPGDRLPAERELALELGVSRPTLREAIQKLAAKGLLQTRHGGGTTVTDRMDAHFADPWQEMLKGHPSLQGDLLEFRHMLESQAARLAAERATDADLERLDAAYAELVRLFADQEDLDGCTDADVAFHQAIAEAAHNVLIGHLTASLMRLIRGHVSSNLGHLHARPRRWKELQSQHQAIWQAIHDRKPGRAAEAAGDHVEFVRESMDEREKEDLRRQSALRRLGEPVS